MSKLSHTSDDGKASMVDVSQKNPMLREAVAEGFISLQQETIQLIIDNEMKKGDVLVVAEIAGVQAAKATSSLIPLCHPLLLSNIQVKARLVENGVHVQANVKCIGNTGVEMEALTSVSIALLTVYDMCKAVDKSMEIGSIHLVSKTKTNL
ncbi:MAG: cyclic pyranopterin monophosphate synthase MoaC [Bacteroidales bacterium]|nr:cyclic pyranopterin monophosphate synthase MoaC [Bacteroidales bacterium]